MIVGTNFKVDIPAAEMLFVVYLFVRLFLSSGSNEHGRILDATYDCRVTDNAFNKAKPSTTRRRLGNKAPRNDDETDARCRQQPCVHAERVQDESLHG